MKQLKLSVKKEGHKFDIRIMPFHKFISYTAFYNDYELFIRFSDSTNKRPYVKYKNLRYSGAISSRTNWNIILNGDNSTCLVNMKNSYLFVKGGNFDKAKSNVEIESFETSCDYVPTSECKCLYDECVSYNRNLYDSIKNKPRFEEELLELITDEYSIYLEEYGSKTAYFKECSRYFKNYLLAEKECPKIAELVSVKDILKQKYECFEGLKIQDTDEFIAYAIDVVAEEYKDEISIYYGRDIIYDAIVSEAMHNIEERQQLQFEKKYSKNSKIQKLLGDKILTLKDPEPLFQQIHFLMLIKEITSADMMLEKADELIEECLAFERLYEQFEDCNYVKAIDLSVEKEQLFLAYEKGTAVLSEDELKEYRSYKVIMPYYYASLYNKKRTKLKPSIEKLDSYFEFARRTIELLIENNIVIKRGDTIEYSDCGNVSKYIKGIELLLASS